MKTVKFLVASSVMSLLAASGVAVADTDSASNHFFANAYTISEEVRTHVATGSTDWAPDHLFASATDISEGLENSYNVASSREKYDVDHVEIPSYHAEIDESINLSAPTFASSTVDF